MIPQQQITENKMRDARAILDEAQQKLSKVLGPEARVYYRILSTKSKNKKKRMEKIKEAVFVHLGISVELAREEGRGKQNVSDARMIAMQIMRENFTFGSLHEVGDLFNRDHSTVVNACRRVREWRKTNPAFRRKYDSVMRAVNLIEEP